jgi:hypothetical protein
MSNIRYLSPLFVIAFALGCSDTAPAPGLAKERVEFSGTLTKGGKPVTDVQINFLPAASGGLQAGAKVIDGKFSGMTNPTLYTWFVSEGSNEELFDKTVPDVYKSANAERTVDIQSGAVLTLTLD